MQTSQGMTVNLTIDEQGNQFFRDGAALTITLTAPNGNSMTLYANPGDPGQNFINTTFSDLATKSIFAGTAAVQQRSLPAVNPLVATWTVVR